MTTVGTILVLAVHPHRLLKALYDEGGGLTPSTSGNVKVSLFLINVTLIV